MANTNPIRVEGLSDLTRAFTRLDRNLGRGIKEAMEAAADPVRKDASDLVRQNVSGMARSRVPWWSMRVGSTVRSAFIAPEQRGVKGRGGDRRRRPNLVGRMDPQMREALARNRDKVEGSVLVELDELFRQWERV